MLGRIYLALMYLAMGALGRWLNPCGPKDAGPANPFAAVGGYPWQVT